MSYLSYRVPYPDTVDVYFCPIKRNFVMTKGNNIEKAYDFGASAFNRKMKRITQDRLKRGLPVSLDIPNDATPEELEELKAFDAWTRDGEAFPMTVWVKSDEGKNGAFTGKKQ